MTTTKKYIATQDWTDNKYVAKETGKGLSANDFTDALKTKLDGIDESADVNVIETVKVNGTALTVTDKAVDVTVPDAAGLIATHNAAADAHSDIRTAIEGKVDKVTGKGLSANDFTDALKTKLDGIAENAQVNVLEGIQFNGTDATVTSKKVNITPALIGAAASSHTHGNADLTTGIDAAKIASVEGSKLPLSVIPQGALEVLKVVADDTARQALTKDDVQNGDVVKVTATNKMYFVSDDTKLAGESWQDAYTEFAAGTAAAVEWANVLNKVNASATADGLMTSAEFSKLDGIAAGAEVNVQADWTETDTSKDSYIQNKPALGTAAAKDFTTSVTENSADLITSGAVYTADAALTTAISTHVAKTDNPHSVTKAQVGLGNCDNTSDADKPVSTATQTALDGKVNGSGYTIGSDSTGIYIEYTE